MRKAKFVVTTYGMDDTSKADREERDKAVEAENEKLEEERAERRRQRKMRTRQPVVSRIPWNLLDELEAEKRRFAEEKAAKMMFNAR